MAATARAPGSFAANAYGIDYKLDLFSNFTYALDDPDHGDQFEQFDDRIVFGGNLRLPISRLGSLDANGASTSGVDIRHDDIARSASITRKQRVRSQPYARTR